MQHRKKKQTTLRKLAAGQAEILQRQANDQAELQFRLRQALARVQELELQVGDQDSSKQEIQACKLADLDAELSHARRRIDLLDAERALFLEQKEKADLIAAQMKLERAEAFAQATAWQDRFNVANRQVRQLEEFLQVSREENASLRLELALSPSTSTKSLDENVVNVSRSCRDTKVKSSLSAIHNLSSNLTSTSHVHCEAIDFDLDDLERSQEIESKKIHLLMEAASTSSSVATSVRPPSSPLHNPKFMTTATTKVN